MRVSLIDAARAPSSLIAASTTSPTKRVCVPRSTVCRTSQSTHASASSNTGAPVVASHTGRPLRAEPSSWAGFENFTNTFVSSALHRLTVKEPPSLMRRQVTASLSTPIPMRTGAIDSWVIQLAVMPLRVSPEREPMRASALGIFHVTLLSSSSSSAIRLRREGGETQALAHLGAAQRGQRRGRLTPRWQAAQEALRDVGDLERGSVERRRELGLRLRDAGDLPDELARGGVDLLAGRGRLEAAELGDVSAHAGQATASTLVVVQGHQIDVLDEPRLVEVIVGDVVVASSTSTRTLHETGLPVRHYFPREDVRMEHLDATPTETVCPFKGQATYWTVRVGDDEHRDLAWSYPRTIDGMEAIAGRICFYAERADHVVDGEPLERPSSPWSPTD